MKSNLKKFSQFKIENNESVQSMGSYYSCNGQRKNQNCARSCGSSYICICACPNGY